MRGCLLHAPYWGPGLQPRLCRDWESNPPPFVSQSCTQSTDPHQPEPYFSFCSVYFQSFKWCFWLTEVFNLKQNNKKLIFLCCLFKKYVPTSRSQGLSCMLVCRNCIVLPFMLRFTSHLGLRFFVFWDLFVFFCIENQIIFSVWMFSYYLLRKLFILHKLLAFSWINTL